MFNKGECSRTNDRFISLYHDNLVKVTFNHFEKQKETFEKRVQEQKDLNKEIKRKIKVYQEEAQTLQKEVEKYNLLCNGRNEDYARIRNTIADEIDEIKTKVQGLTLRCELKESKNRELEVETDNEHNKLSSESQKVGIIEDEVGLQVIQIDTLEQHLKTTKDKNQKIKENLEHLKRVLATVSLQKNQVQNKYYMSKDFVEHINGINDEFMRSMDLLKVEKQSFLLSKGLHEKFNSKLINLIIMNNITHDAKELRQMMTKLDDLNKELISFNMKTEANSCLHRNCLNTMVNMKNQANLRPSSTKKLLNPKKSHIRSKKMSPVCVDNIDTGKSCVQQLSSARSGKFSTKDIQKDVKNMSKNAIHRKSYAQLKSPAKYKKPHQNRRSSTQGSYTDVKVLNRSRPRKMSSGCGDNFSDESSRCENDEMTHNVMILYRNKNSVETSAESNGAYEK